MFPIRHDHMKSFNIEEQGLTDAEVMTHLRGAKITRERETADDKLLNQTSSRAENVITGARMFFD